MRWLALLAFLLLLLIFPKQMFKIGVVAIALLLGISAYYWMGNRQRERAAAESASKWAPILARRAAEYQAVADSIQVTVTYDPAYGLGMPGRDLAGGGSSGYEGDGSPLIVTFTNTGTKTITKTRWYFQARRPGFSNQLVRPLSRLFEKTPYESDKILRPGEHYTLQCKLPPLSDSTHVTELNWEVIDKQVEYEGQDLTDDVGGVSQPFPAR